MLSLNDSNAVLNPERQFSQHQAVVTILQGILPDPRLSEFKWLDLACGNGQIIMHLDTNLHNELRSKIEYFGYDIKEEYLKSAKRKASELNLKNFHFVTGEISNFQMIYSINCKFDCITLINTIHEINPGLVSSLLYESFIRLKDKGFLFIYDMDKINPPELGAITWNNMEFDEILTSFFNYMNVPYLPSSGQWPHSSCNGWNIQLKREYFDINMQYILENKSEILEKTQECIWSILDRKYNDCKNALESFTNNGVDNTQEKLQVDENLFQLWALSRVKEGFK